MTEPVAYYKDYNDGTTLYFRGSSLTETDKRDPLIKPLYEEEQLHPRVKMTQKQYDRLVWDMNNTDLSTCLEYFLEHDGVSKFGKASDNLMGFLKQEDIARAWLNPEKTIEIVPNMKWFVGRNDTSDDHRFLSKNVINLDNELNYAALKKAAKQFDTKEEAEKWTNPLTEAVQLPLEE